MNLNCEKCGAPNATLRVGIVNKAVCYECSKLHRQMTEKLRLEYVEKLKESEDYFFNSAKEEAPPAATFVDDEELYEEVKTADPQIEVKTEEVDSLPQELFG